MAKSLSDLFWVEELLPEDHIRKSMFGGFAYYVDEKLVLVMFEGAGNKTYRGEKYEFEIWNGCMFPVEKENQKEVFQQFDFLISHPVLPKWLYLPADTEDFENNVGLVLRELRSKNPLFGSVPKGKAKKGRTKKIDFEVDENIDTRRPRMFSDEPSEIALSKAKKISDLKNLGSEAEKFFLKAGIKTAAQLIQLGWKEAMAKLCESNPKYNHSLIAYSVIGALKNQVWNRISEEEKAEARAWMKSLRDGKPSAAKKKTKASMQKKKAVGKKKATNRSAKDNRLALKKSLDSNVKSKAKNQVKIKLRKKAGSKKRK